MPALNFPSSPTNGQVFTGANKSWTYDGAKWIITQYDTSTLNDDVQDAIDAVALTITNAKKQMLGISFILS